MSTNNNFIIQVPNETSLELERTSYELDRECMNCVRLITKNVPFMSVGTQHHVDALAEKVAYYDTLKDKLSESVVMPAAIDKWGPKVLVSWTLNFQTKNVTVEYINTENRSVYDSAIDVDVEFSERMRFLSIHTKTFDEIYDKIISTSPTLDTAAYKEFLDAKEALDNEYDEMKMKVRHTYIEPWIAEKFPGEDIRFDWSLTFADAKLTITVE